MKFIEIVSRNFREEDAEYKRANICPRNANVFDANNAEQ